MDEDVRIIDTATPFIQYVVKTAPKAIGRAMKSAGWWLQQEIKAGIRAGAPGGQQYAAFSDITTTRLLEIMRQKRHGGKLQVKKHVPLGKLGPATRYVYYGDSHKVMIGWFQSAAAIGTKQEAGARTPVTEKMRRLFFAAGIPIGKDKRELIIPARPTIQAEYMENAPKVVGYIENKLEEILLGVKP